MSGMDDSLELRIQSNLKKQHDNFERQKNLLEELRAPGGSGDMSADSTLASPSLAQSMHTRESSVRERAQDAAACDSCGSPGRISVSAMAPLAHEHAQATGAPASSESAAAAIAAAASSAPLAESGAGDSALDVLNKQLKAVNAMRTEHEQRREASTINAGTAAGPAPPPPLDGIQLDSRQSIALENAKLRENAQLRLDSHRAAAERAAAEQRSAAASGESAQSQAQLRVLQERVRVQEAEKRQTQAMAGQEVKRQLEANSQLRQRVQELEAVQERSQEASSEQQRQVTSKLQSARLEAEQRLHARDQTEYELTKTAQSTELRLREERLQREAAESKMVRDDVCGSGVEDGALCVVAESKMVCDDVCGSGAEAFLLCGSGADY
jgi:hypothetical protein